MRRTVGEVRGEVATATANLLRTWDAVPAVVRLELRTVAPELVPALDRWVAAELVPALDRRVAAEATLLAAKQEQELAARSLGESLAAAIAARRPADLTAQAHSIAAVHEGMK